MDQPFVTAIITTCRRDMKILERALCSVRSQTYQNIRVIIVDDNREEQRELSEQIAALGTRYPGVLVLKTENGRHGAQAARNTGIHNADGEYLAFLDDDDEWLPEKTEKQLSALLARPDAGMCFCDGNRINENFDPPYINHYHRDGVRPEVTYRDLLRCDSIGTTSQPMIRKVVFDTVGGFDEDFPARQDYEMWVRISSRFPIIGIPDVLFNYYVSKSNQNGQISRSIDKCIEGHTRLYEKYKKDIDADRPAKYNLLFYMAHYTYFKGEKLKGILKYIHAFFVYPKGFLGSAAEKLRQLQEKN